MEKEYVLNGNTYTARYGKYNNGYTGIEVWGDRGPEAKLTLYPNDALMQLLTSNQVYVKQDMIQYNRPHLEVLGYKDTGKRFNYGSFNSVAQVWQLPGPR